MNPLFKSNPSNFSVASIQNLSGKVFVVTGGNKGIGYETCVALCSKGAKVYLASRSIENASQAISMIKLSNPSALIEILQLDLQDLKQVQAAALELRAKEVKVDVLINNAGIMATPFELSKDQIETQFAVNHLGHFLFTRELLPLLLQSTQPRIVNLSSLAHEWAPEKGILFDSINVESSLTNNQRYGQSKLANLLFSRGLNKRYGDRIHVNSCHPGIVNTELLSHVTLKYPILRPIAWIWQRTLMTPAQGALNSLYCATSPDIIDKGYKDSYFIPTACLQAPALISRDDELADRLWDYSTKLVDEKLQ